MPLSHASQGSGVSGASNRALIAPVRLIYRLGRQAASGVLSLTVPGARADVLVLRRGAAVCAAGELGRRTVAARLVRAISEPALRASFDGNVAAYPPGAVQQLPLASWIRSYLESQLDGVVAEQLVRQLAGAPLVLRGELPPEPLDDIDRRLLVALAEPRRLDQLSVLARAPRFRLLAFVYFLRTVGALAVERVGSGPVRSASVGSAGPAAARPATRVVADPRRLAALRLLGVDPAADADAVKRAYHRLARALHPDLQPEADATRRRQLERRFAEVTAAYEALV